MAFLIISGQRAWRSAADGGESKQVHSPFIQDYIERRERQRELRSWTTGSDEGYASAWSRGMTWGNRGRAIGPVEVCYQDAAPDGRGGFYYAVGFGPVGGLFHQNAAGEERRLFHRDRFVWDGLAYQPENSRFVAALGDDDGTHLALLDENGRVTQPLTEGDCHDARPSWDPIRPDTVLYHTAGLARQSNGRLHHGSWEIMELDMAKGEVTPVWRREGMDVLLPRRDRQGRLYALIRPGGAAPVSVMEYCRRIVSMPVIFSQAVFGFASAFTSMFARKPLWRAGTPSEEVDAAPTIRILGRDLETAALQNRGGRHASTSPSLAPESWQLWRRDPDGTEHRIASRVSWYTLDGDDAPCYSTGLAIHVFRDGVEETVYQGSLVEAFVAV